MDKLHREHDFIQNMWKFMKACETNKNHDDEFWSNVHDIADKLSRNYENMSFVNTWICSYLKFLEEETA